MVHGFLPWWCISHTSLLIWTDGGSATQWQLVLHLWLSPPPSSTNNTGIFEMPRCHIAYQSSLFSKEIESLYTNVFMDITAYQRIFWLCQLNLVKLWANSFYQCVGISFWTTWRVILFSRRIVSNDQTYPLKTTTLLRNYSRWVYEQSSSKN